ncbi:methyl-accepting chemotaxis protein [Sagittula sp. S175]|uniref:methyl-accepting chemotaxis protein n=1 Tax=Sagittula sp. S175 TaxID=3415129 RepID=UPI003C7A2EEE
MFRTMPIRTRLVMTGLISTGLVLFTAALGVIGIWRGDVGLQRQIVASSSLRQLMMADMMHEGLSADVMQSLVVGPDAQKDAQNAISEKLDGDIAIMSDALAQLDALELPPEVRTALDIVTPTVEAYMASARETTALALVDRASGRQALPGFLEKFEALEVDLGNLGDLIEGHAIETSRQAQSADDILFAVLVGVAILSTVTMTLTSWRATMSISKPINRLRQALSEVANGDFGMRIGDITRDDDIGAIARDIDFVTARIENALVEQQTTADRADQAIAVLGAGLRRMSAGDFSGPIAEQLDETYEGLRADFNATQDNLSSLIAQVIDSSMLIHGRSSHIHTSSGELSNRTETQAATLEQTAAAIEEMTNNVGIAAQNARSVEVAVQKVRNDVESSDHIVQQAAAAMREIDDSSNQISVIIGMIDDITFQTNLLALNAGIEAARAGEAGLGFAVVAAEVRALAQRSTEAAQEIKELVTRSNGNVQNGVGHVDAVGSALANLVRQVGDVSKLVAEIASGAAEQADGLREINTGVAQLDKVTQQNASMVVEASSAAADMNSEAERLQQIVSNFLITKDAADEHSASPQAAA